jgi:rubrerythrin
MTLIRIADFMEPAPIFRCRECGDLIVFGVVASKDAQHPGSFDRLGLVGSIAEQKPRFCPMCGAKNKWTE